MLRSFKEFQGGKLGATDGEIGQVKDFYFDDQKLSRKLRPATVQLCDWCCRKPQPFNHASFEPESQESTLTGKAAAELLWKKKFY